MVEQLDKTSTNFDMEIKAEQTSVIKFKYLSYIISGKGLNPEILSRIIQTTVALTKHKPTWNSKNIANSSMIRLLQFLSIVLYTCKSWILKEESEP